MAIIKFGSLVVGARGTIGGVVFSAGKSGPNARLWARGANPRSEGQSSQRQRFSIAPEWWRALTDTQRDDWNTWAADPAQELTNALGEPYYIPGYSWFVALSAQMTRAGYAHRDDAPTSTWPAIPVIDAFRFEDSGGDFVCEIDYDTGEFPSGTGIVIMGAYIPRGGRMVQYSGYKLLISGIASPTGTYDFAINWQYAFGLPEVGGRAFLRVFKQNDQGMRGAAWSTFQDYS